MGLSATTTEKELYASTVELRDDVSKNIATRAQIEGVEDVERQDTGLHVSTIAKKVKVGLHHLYNIKSIHICT